MRPLIAASPEHPCPPLLLDELADEESTMTAAMGLRNPGEIGHHAGAR
jgi:hypothetical protein